MLALYASRVYSRACFDINRWSSSLLSSETRLLRSRMHALYLPNKLRLRLGFRFRSVELFITNIACMAIWPSSVPYKLILWNQYYRLHRASAGTFGRPLTRLIFKSYVCNYKPIEQNVHFVFSTSLANCNCDIFQYIL